MKLFIPTIGIILELKEAWSFPLHHEYRNETLFELLGLTLEDSRWNEPQPAPTLVTLPAGAVLRVDRIYIRKGAADFDSITFLLRNARTLPSVVERQSVAIMPARLEDMFHISQEKSTRTVISHKVNKPGRAVRFWAKLTDVNGIDVDILPEPPPKSK